MPEKRIKYDAYVVKMICDKCGKGEMTAGNIMLTSYPPKFPHKCSNCGYEANYFHRYPYTDTSNTLTESDKE